jgi:hypothetical protein
MGMIISAAEVPAMPSVVFTALEGRVSIRKIRWTRRLTIEMTMQLSTLVDADYPVLSGGRCATENREVASGFRAWRAEGPGGHVGQPDVSSAVVALAGDEQRVAPVGAMCV